MDSSKLTPKQARFCQVYVVELNGKKAAIEAGYAAHSAEVSASKMLRIPKVRAELDRLQAKVEKKLEIKKERILKELLRISTSDVLLLFNDDGSAKELKDIPEDARRCISGIETEELFAGRGEERQAVGVTRKFKFWDKTKGLELLGKHLKMYTDKLDVGLEESFLDLLLKARKRSEEKRRAAGTGS
jgi:phage terminase small subunit